MKPDRGHRPAEAREQRVVAAAAAHLEAEAAARRRGTRGRCSSRGRAPRPGRWPRGRRGRPRPARPPPRAARRRARRGGGTAREGARGLRRATARSPARRAQAHQRVRRRAGRAGRRPARARTPAASFASTRSRSTSAVGALEAQRPHEAVEHADVAQREHPAARRPGAPGTRRRWPGSRRPRRGGPRRGARGPSGTARSAGPPWAARSAAPRPSSRGGSGGARWARRPAAILASRLVKSGRRASRLPSRPTNEYVRAARPGLGEHVGVVEEGRDDLLVVPALEHARPRASSMRAAAARLRRPRSTARRAGPARGDAEVPFIRPPRTSRRATRAWAVSRTFLTMARPSAKTTSSASGAAKRTRCSLAAHVRRPRPGARPARAGRRARRAAARTCTASRPHRTADAPAGAASA